jgi:hypothetical protein
MCRALRMPQVRAAATLRSRAHAARQWPPEAARPHQISQTPSPSKIGKESYSSVDPYLGSLRSRAGVFPGQNMAIVGRPGRRRCSCCGSGVAFVVARRSRSSVDAVTKREPCPDIRGIREHPAGRNFIFPSDPVGRSAHAGRQQDRKGGRQAMNNAQGGSGVGPAAAAAVDWRMSSWCAGNGDCVAVGRLPTGDVLVKDTKDPAGPQLRFDASEWRAFVAGVRAGEFD